MKFFADTAEVSEIRLLAALGLLHWVTTNPSLIVKSRRQIEAVITEICTISDGPVSAEVVKVKADTMIVEGRALAALTRNVVVKVLLTEDGLTA